MLQYKFTFTTLLLIPLILFNCKSQYSELEDGIYAEFVTTKGTMVAKLHYEKAPITSANFISLAEGTNKNVDSIYTNRKFYNGTIFHRVIDDFMIQGGDPTGTGTGNPGYKFNDEFNPSLKHDKQGVLSMANSGPNTNGSQFFITDKPTPFLDNKHAVFGELISGLNIQDSISNIETNGSNRPVDSVIINELNIIRKGRKAKSFEASNLFFNHFSEVEKLEKERKEKIARLKNKAKTEHQKQREKATKLPSGTQYYISKKGEGKQLTESSKVLTHYALFFEDGTLLDTSDLNIAEAMNAVNPGKKAANKYNPIKANLSPDANMIPGFKEGLQQLKVGDKATLFIPYHMGYGEAGNRGIPPKTNLIFEVEIIKLTK